MLLRRKFPWLGVPAACQESKVGRVRVEHTHLGRGRPSGECGNPKNRWRMSWTAGLEGATGATVATGSGDADIQT